VRYVRLYADEKGTSRFQDLEFTPELRHFAPPAPPLNVSEVIDASAFMLIQLPAGWTDPMHPVPARQFMLILKGSVEVAAGGETRRFSAGDVILAEDTSGPGHGTTALDELLVAVVRV
jgi:quercetin dioxygenase-like cupin family protein